MQPSRAELVSTSGSLDTNPRLADMSSVLGRLNEFILGFVHLFHPLDFSIRVKSEISNESNGFCRNLKLFPVYLEDNGEMRGAEGDRGIGIIFYILVRRDISY